jgi:ketosteroid isomerase-like protein
MVATSPRSSLTKAEVESAVRIYWSALAAKEAVRQQNCYADSATVFATNSKKLEPVRLVLLRRQREYLTAGTRTTVEIGAMEVGLIGPNHALAAYTIRLDAERVTRASSSGQPVSEEHLENARVTHLFHRENDGALRIIHEHISVPQL